MEEETNRFEIIIYTLIINRWKTNNQDAALFKIESMVGKIPFMFIDYELNYKKKVNNLKDYQELLNKYER